MPKGRGWRKAQVEGDLIRSPCASTASPALDPLTQYPRLHRSGARCHALPCTEATGVGGGLKGGLCRRPRGRSLAAAQGGSRNSCSKASRAHTVERKGVETSKEREEVERGDRAHSTRRRVNPRVKFERPLTPTSASLSRFLTSLLCPPFALLLSHRGSRFLCRSPTVRSGDRPTLFVA